MDILLFVIGFLYFITGRIVRSMYIAIFLATNVFGAISVVSFPVAHEMGDLGLILFILMWILYPTIYGEKVPHYSLLIVLKVFGVFLLLSVFVDLFLYQNSFSDILRTNRRYWLFIAAYPLCFLRPSEISSLIRALVATNVALLLLIFLQYIGIINLFNYDFTSWAEDDFLGFYAPSSLMPTTLILLSILGKDYFPRQRNALLVLCVVAVFMTVIRSYIISFIASAIVILFFGQKFSYRRLGLVISLCALVFVIVTIVPQISSRFSEAEYAMEEGSMAYRNEIFLKAIDEVGMDLKSVICGVGWFNVDVNDFNPDIAKQLIVSTPDISWPMLLGRLGYVGTFVFLCIYILLVKTAFSHKRSPEAQVLLAIVVHLFLVSFTSISFIRGAYLIVPYLLYSYLEQSETLEYE